MPTPWKERLAGARERLTDWTFLVNFSGLRSIWLKFCPDCDIPGYESRTPPTGMVWLVGIYIALYGIASQRFENHLDRIENHTNVVLTQLDSGKEALDQIPAAQGKTRPPEPDLWNPVSVFRSLLGEEIRDRDNVERLRKVVVSKKDDLDGVNLSGVDLSGADLSGASLAGANLQYAVLQGARLTDTRLTRVYLDQADLRDANLAGAYTTPNKAGQYAEFGHAKMRGAVLVGAVLNYADFSCADLSEANLSRADLTLADLASVDLTQANLEEAKFTENNLIRACYFVDKGPPKGLPEAVTERLDSCDDKKRRQVCGFEK